MSNNRIGGNPNWQAQQTRNSSTPATGGPGSQNVRLQNTTQPPVSQLNAGGSAGMTFSQFMQFSQSLYSAALGNLPPVSLQNMHVVQVPLQNLHLAPALQSYVSQYGHLLPTSRSYTGQPPQREQFGEKSAPASRSSMNAPGVTPASENNSYYGVSSAPPPSSDGYYGVSAGSEFSSPASENNSYYGVSSAPPPSSDGYYGVSAGPESSSPAPVNKETQLSPTPRQPSGGPRARQARVVRMSLFPMDRALDKDLKKELLKQKTAGEVERVVQNNFFGFLRIVDAAQSVFPDVSRTEIERDVAEGVAALIVNNANVALDGKTVSVLGDQRDHIANFIVNFLKVDESSEASIASAPSPIRMRLIDFENDAAKVVAFKETLAEKHHKELSDNLSTIHSISDVDRVVENKKALKDFLSAVMLADPKVICYRLAVELAAVVGASNPELSRSEIGDRFYEALSDIYPEGMKQM
jgi:hypothetical protein